MARNYDLMRNILLKISMSKEPLDIYSFYDYAESKEVKEELTRLKEEGLIDSTISFDRAITYGEIRGLTKEGREFLRNIKDEVIWLITRRILQAANLDISYPLLKTVSETIIKRYVISKIPEEIG